MNIEEIESVRFCHNLNAPKRNLKTAESQEIEDHVKKFLKSGGKIKPIAYGVSGLNEDDTITTGHAVPTIVRRQKVDGVLKIRKTSMHKKAMTIRVDRLR